MKPPNARPLFCPHRTMPADEGSNHDLIDRSVRSFGAGPCCFFCGCVRRCWPFATYRRCNRMSPFGGKADFMPRRGEKSLAAFLRFAESHDARDDPERALAAAKSERCSRPHVHKNQQFREHVSDENIFQRRRHLSRRTAIPTQRITRAVSFSAVRTARECRTMRDRRAHMDYAAPENIAASPICVALRGILTIDEPLKVTSWGFKSAMVSKNCFINSCSDFDATWSA